MALLSLLKWLKTGKIERILRGRQDFWVSNVWTSSTALVYSWWLRLSVRREVWFCLKLKYKIPESLYFREFELMVLVVLSLFDVRNDFFANILNIFNWHFVMDWKRQAPLTSVFCYRKCLHKKLFECRLLVNRHWVVN